MNTGKKKRPGMIFIYVIFMVAMVFLCFMLQKYVTQYGTVSYDTYLKDVNSGEITAAEIRQNNEAPTGAIRYSMSGKTYMVYIADCESEKNFLLEKEIPFNIRNVPGENYLLSTILPMLLVAAMIFMIMTFMLNRQAQAGGGGSAGPMGNFTKSRAKKTDPKENRIKFSDVAGLQEEKEELKEVVDFLANPDKYLELGARIPKGVLLVGPPGTGKTLLAKAVAGEAGVPFFTISGSDFVEMFVGVGASRVRDLFQDAKKNAPCIIFIDEIDAVARKRGAGMGGGHDEREQTLNQLLVEMDGFTVNQGIIVMAATNRVDILDSAILRPGRFDRKVGVGRPDVRGREEILRVHARNKKLGDDVNLKKIAQTTAGFSGADLENLMNEAAILAAGRNSKFVTQKDIEQSFVKVGIGQEKKSRLISDEEKRITAYHEMGHAILFHKLPKVGPVHTVSIIPTGTGAAGYTMPLPEKDEMFHTKDQLLQDICVSMGGRIAEELVLPDITTGASQDIRQATQLARDMVMRYGMSEKIGFINYEQQEDEVFMGRDLGHMKTYGTAVYNEIEEEVKRIIDDCYEKAKAIILENRDVLDAGAALLLEKEKISGAEIEDLFEKNRFSFD